LLTPDVIEQLEVMGRVALAALLGSLIGLERELSGKPAGLRTHLLVAAAACLLLSLGDPLLARYAEQHGAATSADPLRLLQAIVIGASFLGAGTIVVDRDARRVEGLTTAASVLVTTGVGAAVALRQHVLAISVTALTLLALTLLGLLERRLGRGG